jgi:hypothetical protein
MKFLRYALPTVAVMLVTGCAQTPESVQPAYMSETMFVGLDCQQLAAERARVSSALATASTAQNQARSNDIAGIILLGIPVSSMSGQNIAPEIARLKGMTEAIEQAGNRKKCGFAPQTPPTAPRAPNAQTSEPSVTAPVLPPGTTRPTSLDSSQVR